MLLIAPANKSFLLLALLVALSLPATAQYVSPVAQGARSGALGGSVMSDDTSRGVALDWRQGFRLTALADKTIRLQLPTGTTGLVMAAYSHRGDVSYHEQQLALGYGIRVSPWLRAAVAARWLHRGTDDAHYIARQWLAPSALLQASLKNTSLTLLAGTRPWDDIRPWRLHLQTAYRPLPQLLTLAELECEERTRLRLAMEYIYEDCWMLRAGMATQPVVLTFGLGVHQRHYSVDLAVEMHDALGITPQISLVLWF
ncbi:MAG: hypothetical protein IK058_04135 [Bacteroidales bacterium]|nr:hypothetical protein [Bacteroidales bacterium]